MEEYPILQSFHYLQEQNLKFSDSKIQFVSELAKALPHADPYVQTEDQSFLDIIWEEKLVIGLVEDDSVGISDYTRGEKRQFKFFTKDNYKAALEYIISSPAVK